MNASAPSTAAMLARSGQLRVLVVSLSVFIVGGVLAWALVYMQAWLGSLAFPLAMVSAVVAVVALGIAVLRVQCSGCGLRWVPWAMGHQPIAKWLVWLFEFDSCPQCGHSAGEGRQENGPT
jgi:hypothetical protein